MRPCEAAPAQSPTAERRWCSHGYTDMKTVSRHGTPLAQSGSAHLRRAGCETSSRGAPGMLH
eukprot:scaffold98814_cov73-Phaeocystis_antarctica.AAC.10